MLPLKSIWIKKKKAGRMDAQKGIGVLYESGLIFPLISTTSNRKVLEPKNEMHLNGSSSPRGENKQRNQADNTDPVIWDQNQTVNKHARRPLPLARWLSLCLNPMTARRKHSFIVFSEARPAVPAVGMATPHHSNQRLWRTYCLQHWLH